MTDLRKFRNEILVYTALTALLAEIISLFVIGFSLKFLTGLFIGTTVTALGFVFLVHTGQILMSRGKKSPIVSGYFVRLVGYAVSFFFCIKWSLEAGAGCVCGFLSLHAGILLLYGIVYGFIKKKKNPLNDWIKPKKWNDLSIYDEEDDKW